MKDQIGQLEQVKGQSLSEIKKTLVEGCQKLKKVLEEQNSVCFQKIGNGVEKINENLDIFMEGLQWTSKEIKEYKEELSEVQKRENNFEGIKKLYKLVRQINTEQVVQTEKYFKVKIRYNHAQLQEILNKIICITNAGNGFQLQQRRNLRFQLKEAQLPQQIGFDFQRGLGGDQFLQQLMQNIREREGIRKGNQDFNFQALESEITQNEVILRSQPGIFNILRCKQVCTYSD